MKQVKLLFGVLSIVLATSLTTVAQNGNPNGNGNQSNGQVVGQEADGSLVIIDQETGTIFVMSPSDLTLRISVGDEVIIILINTPNGNQVVQVIKKGNS